jgi:hypothetical protein
MLQFKWARGAKDRVPQAVRLAISPKIHRAMSPVSVGKGFFRPENRAFGNIPPIPIDPE